MAASPVRPLTPLALTGPGLTDSATVCEVPTDELWRPALIARSSLPLTC